jgi:hypothetical protein
MSKNNRARKNRQMAEMSIMGALQYLRDTHSYLNRADRPLQPEARADLERVVRNARQLINDDDTRREFKVGDDDLEEK